MALVKNTWYQVELVIGVSQVTFSIKGNGVNQTKTFAAKVNWTKTRPLKIGAGPCPVNNKNIKYLSGLVYDFAIWTQN